jgi:ubiquitin C-terminal hydrolase
MFFPGHYEADVYNLTTRKWNHYNDEIVTSRMEEEEIGRASCRERVSLSG